MKFASSGRRILPPRFGDMTVTVSAGRPLVGIGIANVLVARVVLVGETEVTVSEMTVTVRGTASADGTERTGRRRERLRRAGGAGALRGAIVRHLKGEGMTERGLRRLLRTSKRRMIGPIRLPMIIRLSPCEPRLTRADRLSF